MKSTTVFLGVARKVSFTLGTLFALCLMALASMGGVASAHTVPSQPNVQANTQTCNQNVQSEAKNFSQSDAQGTQVCVNFEKFNPFEKFNSNPWHASGDEGSHGSHPSHKKVNTQTCNQNVQSEAKNFSQSDAQGTQVCAIF